MRHNNHTEHTTARSVNAAIGASAGAAEMNLQIKSAGGREEGGGDGGGDGEERGDEAKEEEGGRVGGVADEAACGGVVGRGVVGVRGGGGGAVGLGGEEDVVEARRWRLWLPGWGEWTGASQGPDRKGTERKAQKPRRGHHIIRWAFTVGPCIHEDGAPGGGGLDDEGVQPDGAAEGGGRDGVDDVEKVEGEGGVGEEVVADHEEVGRCAGREREVTGGDGSGDGVGLVVGGEGEEVVGGGGRWQWRLLAARV